jgi:hypothetical protein
MEHADLYNGWEQITTHDRTQGCMNLAETRDFMPQMGPMVGYAVTVVIEPSNPSHPTAKPNAWSEYRRYVAEAPGPKIVVVQDLELEQGLGHLLAQLFAQGEHKVFDLCQVRPVRLLPPIQESVDQLFGLRHQVRFLLLACAFHRAPP